MALLVVKKGCVLIFVSATMTSAAFNATRNTQSEQLRYMYKKLYYRHAESVEGAHFKIIKIYTYILT